MNTLLIIFSFIVFTGLITTISLTYGIQKSISDSYYRFNKIGKALFTLVIWAFSIPLIFVADKPLFMVAVSFLCLVGTAVNFKQSKMQLDAHMIGAFGGILLAYVSLLFELNMWPIVILFIMITGLLFYLKALIKYIWWIEIAAFYLILIGLAIVKL